MSDPVFTQLPIALYARLSVNPDGKKDSVPTQLKQGRVECARRWPGRAVIEYTDDGITAGDDTVYRPGYEAMLSAIRAGEVGGVIARTQARISRHETIWPAFKLVCLASGITHLHTWSEGDLPMLDGESLGPDVTNLLNAHLRKIVRKNVNQTLDTRAQEGRPSGTTPYGYKLLRDGAGVSHLVVRDDQAAYVMEMADRFIKGHTFAEIARWLNAKRVPTAKKSKAWTGQTVKGAITNRTVTGLRVHRGETVGEGNWDAIIPRETWEAIGAILSAPRQVVRSDGTTVVMTGRRRASDDYVLSGVTHCGKCEACLVGGQMYHRVGTARRTEGRTTSYYLCKKRSGGCNGLGIKARETEEFVTEGFMDFLGSPAFTRYLRTVDKDRSKRAKLQHQIEGQKLKSAEAGEAYASDRITLAALTAVEDRVKANVVDLQAQLRALAPSPVTDDPAEIRADWQEMTTGERRTLLVDFRTRVTIGSAQHGNRFSVDRIDAQFGVL